MPKTAYVIDESYEKHDAVANHPERPERIGALIEMMSLYRRNGLVSVEPRLATLDELLANHSRELVQEVEATAGKALHVFDADTAAGSDTYETARLASGGLLAVLDAIIAGEADNGFALVRPPGHHAEADRAMGFCFFNHVAVGARYLQSKHKVKKIAIVDWDVHHGNGTQRSFYANNDILFISTHQYPHYPGTGAATESGVADGMGYTVNLPFLGGFGDAEYAEAFSRVIEPIARQFEPEFVMISVGTDCHDLDPLGDMHVTADGFARMTQGLLSVANEFCDGRCVATLEGGYSLEGLQEGVKSVLDEMGEANPLKSIPGDSQAGDVIDSIIDVQRRFWEF